jgi:hypothetical protein
MADLPGYMSSMVSAIQRFFGPGQAQVQPVGAFDQVSQGAKGGASGYVVGSGVDPVTAARILRGEGVDVKPQQFSSFGPRLASALGGFAGAAGGLGSEAQPTAPRQPRALPPISFPELPPPTAVGPAAYGGPQSNFTVPRLKLNPMALAGRGGGFVG